jgi:muconolactone delta-isomerase
MEYLVTMTTHVPDGTPEQAVDDVRAREAAHSRDLATAGQLLRLWRPPLQPGEWRSLGLFAAGDAGQLQQTLASMPLKIWRTDQVTPLAPHPNDPGPSTRPAQSAQSGAEFLATFMVTIPDGTPRQAVEDAEAREAARARELADQGHLERLWALPGSGTRSRLVPGQGQRGDGSHRESAPARPVDDDRTHAAHAAPKRSRDHEHLKTEKP